MQENDRLLQWIQSSEDSSTTFTSDATYTSDRNMNRSEESVASTSDPVLVILKETSNSQEVIDEKTPAPTNKDDKDHVIIIKTFSFNLTQRT